MDLAPLRNEGERDSEFSVLDHAREMSKSNEALPSLDDRQQDKALLPKRPFHSLKGPELVAWVMERACLRKANLSKDEADSIVDLHAAEGNLIYYYKCEFCSSYHLTHKQGTGGNQVSVI